MKLLLDTHLLLWATEESAKVSKAGRDLIMNSKNELYFSVCSIWEAVIKNALGKDTFEVDGRILRRSLLDNNYLELPITSEHVIAVASLPLIHKDPFDRLLIAQAMAEGITLLTVDSKIAKYPGSILKV